MPPVHSIRGEGLFSSERPKDRKDSKDSKDKKDKKD